MTCQTIQYIEGAAFTVAGVCTPLAAGLDALGYKVASVVAASLAGGAISLKAFLSSSPKDSPSVQPTLPKSP